jgi:bacteriochlorophyllide a dehydrogenase
MLDALAIVLEKPERITLGRLPLAAPTPGDVVVRTLWSGISTGTERLLFDGRMPAFPGMGYPLVPGYETVGRIVAAGAASGMREGDMVFVPGARCYGEVRGLFGGAASQLVSNASRVIAVDETLGENAILLALAANAFHALDRAPCDGDLIVGHGVLGRLLARLACLDGGAPPTVWEADASRRAGASGYRVVGPDEDGRRDYRRIIDASGDSDLLDDLVARLAPGGEIVLAGFYDTRLSFAFAPAFMREARLRVAAEWRPADLVAVKALVEDGRLSLDGLITHRRPATDAASAYPIAFRDPSCLKMALDWRQCT